MTQDEQVQKNYEAFKKMLPDLIVDKSNKHALLRDEQLTAVFDTLRDAITAAEKMYPDGRWSIQHITIKPVDLGRRSRAVRVG
jgi:hypothetical protein